MTPKILHKTKKGLFDGVNQSQSFQQFDPFVSNSYNVYASMEQSVFKTDGGAMTREELDPYMYRAN